jgi:hypothetical protein
MMIVGRGQSRSRWRSVIVDVGEIVGGGVEELRARVV